MQKNAVITFVENHKPETNQFKGTEKIFSMPYALIEEAMEFCALEGIDKVYVGFKFDRWQINVSRTGMSFSVMVTKDGLHDITKKQYVYTISRVAPLLIRSMPD